MLAGTKNSLRELPLAILIITAPVSNIMQSKNPIFSDEVFTLVELAGTAPASAGLSWPNLSYRCSLFKYFLATDIKTNKSVYLPQSWS